MQDFPDRWLTLTLLLMTVTGALGVFIGRVSVRGKKPPSYADAEKAVNDAFGVRVEEADTHSQKKTLTKPLEKARKSVLEKLKALSWTG